MTKILDTESYVEENTPCKEFSLGVFDTKTAAIDAGRRKGWYQSDGLVRQVTILTLSSTGERFVLRYATPVTINSKEGEKEAKERALAKLTFGDKVALGLILD